jgi:hypothetical protein
LQRQQHGGDEVDAQKIKIKRLEPWRGKTGNKIFETEANLQGSMLYGFGNIFTANIAKF